MFLAAEVDIVQAGSSSDSSLDAHDNSGTQESFALSAGLDF